MQQNRTIDKYTKVKQIYHVNKSPLSVSKLKHKSPSLLFKQKQQNQFKRSIPKEIAKQQIEKDIIKSSKTYRELQVQILIQIRRHLFQMDRLSQINNSKTKQVKKIKKYNRIKQIQLQKLDSKLDVMSQILVQQEKYYSYLASNINNLEIQSNQSQNEAEQQNYQQQQQQKHHSSNIENKTEILNSQINKQLQIFLIQKKQ